MENIIISHYGLKFDRKLLDFFHWKAPKAENIQDDIVDSVKIFYDALGGKKYYAKQPQAVKYICSGLRRGLILKKFPKISALKSHLENIEWD